MNLSFGGIISPIGAIVFAILIFLPFIWAAYQIIRREKGVNLILWSIVILCLPLLGPVLYYFSQYRKQNLL